LRNIKTNLDYLRTNDRKLTDSKYRGLSELVKDIQAAIDTGKVAQVLDMSTILLIAMAPDILSFAMAALARSFTKSTEPTPLLPWGQMFWRRLMRNRRYLPTGIEVDNLKNLVTEQLRYRVSGGPGDQPGQRPPSGAGIGGAGISSSGGLDAAALAQSLRPLRRPVTREPTSR
ncbi:MAG: hypothetical protein WCK65_01325, partial [Rhodospirillaceae bacterium]